MIDVIGVTKRFGGKRDVLALDNVIVTIPKGELVSVVGASGSGKSAVESDRRP
jgi:phosphonate transport system ATP-binding protein